LKKRVFWSLSDRAELAGADLFLSELERSIYDGFRFDLRRESFLAGRWIAKRLIRGVLDQDRPPSEISVLNDPDGEPYAVIDGERLAGVLSLSHAGEWAVAALSLDGVRVGVDVEVVRPRPASFAGDYFTPGELDLLQSPPEDYDRDVTLIWSAKEAMLKALGLGLRLDTRRVRVTAIGRSLEPDSGVWKPLSLSSEGSTWSGRWQTLEGGVLVCAVEGLDERDTIDLVEV
jgi:4'-phosphopantetheinyl transferase